MGVIVNQPLENVDFATLLEQADIPTGAGDHQIPVYFGGPVDRARGFVLHSGDYQHEDMLIHQNNIAVSANTGILRDMAGGKGPRKSLLVVGYAGWAPGQLEQEIESNSWITVPASEELLFSVDDEMKWGTASQSLGVDMSRYSTIVGHA